MQLRLDDLIAFADELPLDLWVRDPQSRCTYANAAAKQRWPGLLGSTPETIEVAAHVREVWRANNRRALSGEVVRGEVEYPQGRFLNVVAPLRRDGVVAGTIGINLDVTAWRSTEQQLQEKRELLALVSEHAPVLVGVRELVGDEIIHRYDNRRGAALFGRQASELEGVSERELGVSEDVLRRARARFMESARSAQPVPFELLFPQENTTRVLQGVVSPLAREGAEHPTFAVVGEDVTERRFLEGQLRAVDRLASLETTIATLGHELANPALYALVALDELRRELDAAEELGQRARGMHELLDTAAIGVRQMLGVARELRQLSRPSDQDVRQVSLNQIVQSVLQLLDTAGVTVQTDLAPQAELRGRSVQLAQLVLNLLKNALEAVRAPRPSADPARIRVVTRQLQDELQLEVEDSGPGVPASLSEQDLFQAFVTSKAAAGGTGLGLYVVRQVATDHGGEVQVLPAETLGGARFRVRLRGIPE